jgi:hypothetical protein
LPRSRLEHLNRFAPVLSVPALCRGKSIVAIDVMCNPDQQRYLDGLSRLTGDALEKTAIFAV